MKVELALCRAEDPELWFPVSYQATTPQVMEAKAICRTCPITADCLQYALQAGEAEGIWGGLTPSERRRALTVARVTVDGPLPDGLTAVLDDLARTVQRNHSGEATP